VKGGVWELLFCKTPLDPSPEIPQDQYAMAVPKRRTSHARQGKRRSHQHLKPIQIQYCPQCNEPVLPHRVCPNCGHYQGREVVAEEEK
jgi:large subunit ribosomal protein L32